MLNAAAAPEGIVDGLEARLARFAILARCGFVLLFWQPLLQFDQLQYPWVAILVCLLVGAEVTWAYRHVRRARRLDDIVIWADCAMCVALFLGAPLLAGPSHRASIENGLMAFGVASAGIAGIGLGLTRRGLGFIAAYEVSAVPFDLPSRGAGQVASDLVGYTVWFVIVTFIARGTRDLARMAEVAAAERERSREEIAERVREADLAQQRELIDREIHEHLLPIVDAVASGSPMSPAYVRLAAREATRARRLIVDGEASGDSPSFEAIVGDVCETYLDAGLHLAVTKEILAEPPTDVGTTMAYAAREALRNVLKHAGPCGEVVFVAISIEAGVEIVVRDHGIGFDVDQAISGGGFTKTYEAVRRRGGAVDVISTAGRGTKVVMRWPAPSTSSARATGTVP